MTKHTLAVRTGGGTTVLLTDEIYCAESFGRKVVLHLEQEELEYYGRISDLVKQLPTDFFQVHRSYLINMAKVIGYDRQLVCLSNGDCVPISKYRFKDFAETYETYCKQR